MFYCHHEPIAEEAESKLSSEGEIRTDVSNTDESFELQLQPYIDFCDDLDDDEEAVKEDAFDQKEEEDGTSEQS